MITELNEQNFDTYTKTGLKLVEFYADWCGFCKRQRPILEELTDINIGTVNVDKNPEIVRRFSISGFPSFILFKDGKSIATLEGLHDKSQLLTKLMENLG